MFIQSIVTIILLVSIGCRPEEKIEEQEVIEPSRCEIMGFESQVFSDGPYGNNYGDC